ncbi:XRE family transcriptional regulator [Enterococcus faecium]|nr:XRE family transcriptional regulator [Enterococcus faecium]
MIDVAKLKGLIVERGTTQQAVADSIGINRSTFYRKMKNGGNFTVAEAKKIKEEVPLTDSEAAEIFLVKKSRFRDLKRANNQREEV